MLGLPTVVTDNTYGKLRGTFEAFTRDAPLARWAETPSEALTVAGDLLAHGIVDGGVCSGP
jgi:exopolysaccharide biosynthesis predicted pyruvyltransferase EpsI